MEKAEFYKTCSELFQVDDTFADKEPITRVNRTTCDVYQTSTHATRWGGREPGNGRFKGFGLVRYFSKDCIHVCLRHPQSVNKVFKDPEEALQFLRDLMS